VVASPGESCCNWDGLGCDSEYTCDSTPCAGGDCSCYRGTTATGPVADCGKNQPNPIVPILGFIMAVPAGIGLICALICVCANFCGQSSSTGNKVIIVELAPPGIVIRCWSCKTLYRVAQGSKEGYCQVCKKKKLRMSLKRQLQLRHLWKNK